MEKIKKKKTGGRVKGTPNKTTSLSKRIIADLLSTYYDTGQMTEDFVALEPRDRLTIAEKLIQYVMPKMQATSIDLSDEAKTITIEAKLRELASMPEEDAPKPE